MCDYVEEAIFEQLIEERKLERMRLHLARCLKKAETAPAVSQEPQPALTT